MSEAFGLWFGGSHLGYGTHLPVLASAVLQAGPGPVLEYGLGFYSTPLLHLMCHEMGRKLLSLESDKRWADGFAGIRQPHHEIVGVDSWAASEKIVDAFSERWAVVFIDHGPDERRVVDAHRLADRAEFVVVHDWCQPPSSAQAELESVFAYRWVSRCGPQTAVLSNVRPFEFTKSTCA